MSNQQDHHKRLLVMTEGLLGPFSAKTAASVIRYRRPDVVAVLDSTAVGQSLGDHFGFAEDLPIVGSVADAARLEPDGLLVGIAPVGGQLPEPMRRHALDAIEAGLDIISGLHVMLADDEELSAAAKTRGVRIWDVRDPGAFDQIAFARARQTRARRVLTVGSDCAVGKMVCALEMRQAALDAGRDATFVATGQTGIMIEGWGMSVDRVIADFAAGAAEWLIEQVKDRELVFIEGQGSITHPGYSGVTLALLHGTCPDAMVMCIRPGRTHHHEMPDCPIPPLPEQIALYESITQSLHPAKVAAVSVNTFGLSDEKAQAELDRVRKQTGLPATDPIRYGATVLLDAVV